MFVLFRDAAPHPGLPRAALAFGSATLGFNIGPRPRTHQRRIWDSDLKSVRTVLISVETQGPGIQNKKGRLNF
jgi:hypothetical protein